MIKPNLIQMTDHEVNQMAKHNLIQMNNLT